MTSPLKPPGTPNTVRRPYLLFNLIVLLLGATQSGCQSYFDARSNISIATQLDWQRIADYYDLGAVWRRQLHHSVDHSPVSSSGTTSTTASLVPGTDGGVHPRSRRPTLSGVGSMPQSQPGNNREADEAPENPKKPDLSGRSRYQNRNVSRIWPTLPLITVEYFLQAEKVWFPRAIKNYSSDGTQWRDPATGMIHSFRSRTRPRAYEKPLRPKPPKHFKPLAHDLPYVSLVFFRCGSVGYPAWMPNYIYNDNAQLIGWRDPLSGHWHWLDGKGPRDVFPHGIPPHCVPGVSLSNARMGISHRITNYRQARDGTWCFKDLKTGRFYAVRDHPVHREAIEEPTGFNPFPAFSPYTPRPDGPFFGQVHPNLNALDLEIVRLKSQFRPRDDPPRGIRASPSAIKAGRKIFTLRHDLWIPNDYKGTEIPWQKHVKPYVL